MPPLQRTRVRLARRRRRGPRAAAFRRGADYDDTWLRDSGPITLREGDGLPPARFPLHRLGRQVRGRARRPARRRARVRNGLFAAAAHERIDFALEGGAHRDRRRRHAAVHLALPARAPPAALARRDRRASCASRCAQAARALARPRLPGRRRHRRAHRHPRPLRPRRDASSTRAATIRPTATTPNCRRWPTSSPRCARVDGQPYRLFALPWAKPILDEGRRLAASYANFLIINGARADARLWRSRRRATPRWCWPRAFPEREIVPVRLPPADLAERQPALHHHAVARRSAGMSNRAERSLRVALVQERDHGGRRSQPGADRSRASRAPPRSGARAGAAAGTAQRRLFLPARGRSTSSTTPRRSPARAPSASARWRRSTAW